MKSANAFVLCVLATASPAALGQAGGWKQKEFTIDGNVTAAITTAEIKYKHYFGFLPANGHTRTFEGPGSGWNAPWLTVNLPYGQIPPSNPYVSGPTTRATSYHGGVATSDWSLPEPVFDPVKGKTILSVGAYAQINGAPPSLLHLEQMSVSQCQTWANVGGNMVMANAADIHIKVPWTLPFTSGSNSAWCNIAVNSDPVSASQYIASGSTVSNFRIDLDGATLWSSRTTFGVTGGGRASAADGVGLTLSAPLGGTADAGTTLTDWSGSGNSLSLTASIANGVFTASSAWSSFPWQLTYEGTAVIRAFLPAGESQWYDWSSPTIPAGTHAFGAYDDDFAEEVIMIPSPGAMAVLCAGLFLIRRRSIPR